MAQESRIPVGGTANEHVTRYHVLKGFLCQYTSLKTNRIKGAQNQNFRLNITAILSICKPSIKTLPFEGMGERGGGGDRSRY